MTLPTLLRKLRSEERKARNTARQAGEVLAAALYNQANAYAKVVGWLTTLARPVKARKKP